MTRTVRTLLVATKAPVINGVLCPVSVILGHKPPPTSYYSQRPRSRMPSPVTKETGMSDKTPTQAERIDELEKQVAAIKEALASADPSLIAAALAD